MADEQVPSQPQPLSAKATAAIQSARAAASVGLGPKGADGKDGTQGEAGSAPAQIPLRDRLLNLGAQVVFLLAATLFLFVVLRLCGMPVRAGIVAAVILALVASSFIRSFIRWPLPKEALAAARPQLPPNIRPSESSGREVVETVVFVVVLVLLLKSFAAEAFVIPTGSMAETLYGYQKMVTCPTCGQEFPVNCSQEVDPQDSRERVAINFCTCPNCRQNLVLVDPKRDGREPPRSGTFFLADGTEYREIPDPGSRSGDRVLVGKFFDFTRALHPQRLSVVVFKFPEGPQKNQVAMNYIKRLIGLPGETIAICGGNLYLLRPERGLTYDDSNVPPAERTPKERWRPANMHTNDARAMKAFSEGKFEIIRKPPETLLAMMRLVYDNDHQASDLQDRKHQRWLPEGDAWEDLGDARAFRHGARTGGSDQVDWIHYRHLLRGLPDKSLITDFMGYNSGGALVWEDVRKTWGEVRAAEKTGSNWVGDLVLECEVQVEQAEGELVLQLVRGGDTFRATWDLSSANGLCTLTRTTGRRDGKQETVKLGDARPTRLGKGKHRLRFANVDDRLTVWVDGELPFGDGETYPVEHPEQVVPTAADLRPASIGVKGGSLSVRHIKLFRDTHYTVSPSKPDTGQNFGRLTNPEEWKGLTDMPVLTLYVQPGHYLCLGDNSPASADSRSWGLVPERLMLGKALLVYFPFSRAGRIR